MSNARPSEHSPEKPGKQTLSQHRAKFALDEIKAVISEPFGGELLSHAASLPAMIQMNGFGQALAFYGSKKYAAYQRLYGIVARWLTQAGQPYAAYEKETLMDGIVEGNMSAYRLAQTESLALLDWVKRFAKTYLKESNNKKPVAKGASTPAADEAATP